MSVRRWSCVPLEWTDDWGMEPKEDGDFVAYEDYAAVEQQLTKAQSSWSNTIEAHAETAARLAERELDWLNQCEQIKDLQERLAELREAAGKVTCRNCGGDGDISQFPDVEEIPCPDCADLRRLLGESHE